MEDRIRYPEIDMFLRSVITREAGYLKSMEDYARVSHISIIPPETAALLKVLVKLHKPARILEAGTAIGYSTCIMAEAMPQGAIIDTIEIDEEMAEKAEKNIETMGFSKQVRILRGDALNVMECLTTPYDMIFLDAAKGQYTEYLEESLRILKPGGLLVSDNVLYKGLVAQNEPFPHKHRTIAVKLREYLRRLCHDDRIHTSIVPIGDGMTISIMKGDKYA